MLGEREKVVQSEGSNEGGRERVGIRREDREPPGGERHEQ